MPFENPVKQLLKKGGTAWGAGSVIADALAVQLTADSGVDFVWMDTEHMPYGTESMALLPTLCRRKGVVPLVRVANLDAGLIKKALDIGAQAIMIPQVDNAEMARAVVQYAKYPPMGNRGVSPMFSFYNGISWDEYLPHANAESLIIVQVETLEGVKNVEEIAAVEGVDVVLAGPMDLSASFGVIGEALAHCAPPPGRLEPRRRSPAVQADFAVGFPMTGLDTSVPGAARNTGAVPGNVAVAAPPEPGSIASSATQLAGTPAALCLA